MYVCMSTYGPMHTLTYACAQSITQVPDRTPANRLIAPDRTGIGSHPIAIAPRSRHSTGQIISYLKSVTEQVQTGPFAT